MGFQQSVMILMLRTLLKRLPWEERADYAKAIFNAVNGDLSIYRET